MTAVAAVHPPGAIWAAIVERLLAAAMVFVRSNSAAKMTTDTAAARDG